MRHTSGLLRRAAATVLAAAVVLTTASFPSLAKTKARTPSTTDIVNSQVLTPTSTGYAPWDETINAVIAQVTTPTMTTDQKLRACYDYIITTCSYGYNDGGWFVPDDAGAALEQIEAQGIPTQGPYFAWTMLTYHQGVCDHYASAFAAMARAIGVNAYTHSGRCRSSKGGYSNHTWAIVKMNGVEYICDPQVDDNIYNRRGSILYDRYMKTYAERPNEYQDYAINWNQFIPLDMYQATGVSRDDFDPVYYATKYPEVAAAVGMSADALLQHYLEHGQAEGRFPTVAAEYNALGVYDEATYNYWATHVTD